MKLQNWLIGFTKISALSFRNLPGSSSIPLAALIISTFSIFKKVFLLKYFSCETPQGFQNSNNNKMRILSQTFEGSDNLKDAKYMKKLLKVFEIVSMSYVNKYFLSITLKFKTTVSGCPTIPLVCQHFLGVFLRRLFLLPLTLMCQIIDFLKEFFT